MTHVISLIVFLPLIGVLIPHRLGPLAGALLSFVLGASQVFSLGAGGAVAEKQDWIPSLNILYELRLDGMSAPLLFLVVLVFAVLQIVESRDRARSPGIRPLLSLAETSLLGLCVSQNFFLTAFLLMVTVIPFFLLVAIFGEKGEDCSYRFLTLSALSNGLIFVLVLLVYVAGGQPVGEVGLTLLMVAFALRLPVWPLHGWFMDLCRSADATLLTALTGGLIPVMLFTFLKLATGLFPAQLPAFGDLFAGLGSVLMVAGALGALAEHHFRSFTASLSLWMVGATLIGISGLLPEGAAGSLYLTVSLGLSIAALSILVGALEKRARSQRSLENGKSTLGALHRDAPFLTTAGALVLFSVAGLPGLAAFAGHALVAMGVLHKYPWAVAIATLTFLVLAGACVRLFREVFLSSRSESAKVSDLGWLEQLSLWPFLVALVGLGFFPRLFLDLIFPVVRGWGGAR